MKIIHIVCCDKNGGIAKDGKMPWHLPNELKHFANVTHDSVMVMGSKTVESLPNSFFIGDRSLIELTSKVESFQYLYWNDGIPTHVAPSAEEIISWLEVDVNEVLICGGAQTYSAFPPDEIIMTIIDDNFDCDTFYPFFQLDTGDHYVECKEENWKAYRIEVVKI